MAVLLLILALVLAHPAFAAEDEKEDTPLQARAKSLLRSYPEAKTKDAQLEVRERLVAMADTLERKHEDVLASHCLERAGMVGYRLAEYESACEIWKRGLAVARRSGDKKRIAALLNAQAVGVSITGDDQSAVTLQIELIALRQEIHDIRGEGISWHNLAFSYFALFRYPEAIDALSHALRLHREAGNQFALAGSMGTLANALFEVGQTADALAMADSAVARCREVEDPSLLGSALQGRGRQRHYLGRYEESLADFREAHEVLRKAGDVRVAATNDLNWANALISLDRCEEARELVDEATKALQPLNDQSALVWGQCVTARITARCGNRDAARARLLATIDQLEAVRDSIPDELSRADAFRMAGGAYTDLAWLEIEAGNQQAAWQAVESSSARVLRDAIGVGAMSSTMSLAALQHSLGEIDAVALQYGFPTEDRLVACVITPSSVRAYPLRIKPGFRSDLNAALVLMASGASDEDFEAVRQRLSAVLVAPLADALTRAGRRLVVFPGGLSGLPVEALRLEGDASADLGERFAISYCPSATSFLSLQGRPVPTGSIVVFADPGLGTGAAESEVARRSARMHLTPLPQARAEGEAIGRGDDLLVGDDATRAAYFDRAGNAAVLHLAAHAVIDATHPEHSGIVLAGEGGDLLTAGELQSLPIRADLVSLSGCETAGGYLSTGEGAFGLTRAFLVAGARSVVSSWWSVEDGAARRFMELFYEGLRRGEARDFALQKARTMMAEEGYPLRDRTAFALAGVSAKPVAAMAAASSKTFNRKLLAIVAVALIAVALLGRRHRAGSRNG